ncbi:hypothetical protein LSG31_14780 [Fodinisporobacter ferrooxydans]|uniref:Uncharacterized protein n=1 Tax=Fodinisporobacter ferrooxydans TaxID=2901836 RepID=A0ABY4CFW2_9BACL|nr:hypothetical protein LSG31_14780 [Alicyclobacillaceae bacterium MYW30-H2]
MKRERIQSLASICFWIGGTGIAASFATKMVFHYQIHGTPYFFGILLLGIFLFISVKLIG